MVFIIGDIHGEITKLQALIKNICSIDPVPSFIFIGDYIDKGEDAKQTLDYLIELNKRFSCKYLMGNHEYFWMRMDKESSDVQSYLTKYGGMKTMQAFHCRDILETKNRLTAFPYSSFFGELLPFVQYNDYTIVHSGIPPAFYQTPTELIPADKLLFNRYDFISSTGYYLNRYKVIFGHTGFYTPYYDGYKIGVDTAACFLESQPLTAFNADKDYFVDSSDSVKQLDSLSSSSCPNILRNKPWRT